jgi:hypothetical protein
MRGCHVQYVSSVEGKCAEKLASSGDYRRAHHNAGFATPNPVFLHLMTSPAGGS